MDIYKDLGLSKKFAAMLSEQEVVNAVKLLRLSVQFDIDANIKRGSQKSRRAIPIPDAIRGGLFQVNELHFIFLLGIIEAKVVRSMTGELTKRSKGNQALYDAEQATLAPMPGAFGSTVWEPKKTISKDEVRLVQANLQKYLQEEQAVAQSGIVDKGLRRVGMRDEVESLRQEWRRLKK